MRVTDVRRLPGSGSDAQTGLLGYVQFVICGVVRVDGVTLRRTRGGRLALSYPVKKYGPGAQYPLIKPVDEAVRREVERQVFAALDLGEAVA